MLEDAPPADFDEGLRSTLRQPGALPGRDDDDGSANVQARGRDR